MASSRSWNMSKQQPPLKTEQSDMDSFFDFNQGSNQSPAASSSKMEALFPFEKEERQQFAGPSHDYGQFRQQVGLPVGSLANMPQMSNSNGMFDGFNSGIGEMDFGGWNTGLDMDGDMGMDLQPMPAMFFPAPGSPTNNFVDPSSLAHEESQSHVGRLWPGMHSQQAQQAAMAKATQAQAMQQRQLKIQAQQAQYRQAGNSSQSQSSQNSQGSSQQTPANGKRVSHASEPHVEDSISRLLNQMRQNSAAGDEDADSPSDLLPHVARLKKDEEDMDEDERLLASEEGKKLSSKERRQLRNKVSARAFRSRRKEYIGQLEGEIALKTQESSNLRSENQALMQENERYRGLIETLLRHPAFHPFINDISKDPSALGVPPPQRQQHSHSSQQSSHMSATPAPQQQPTQQQQQPQPPAPQSQDEKPDFLDFDASQLQIPQQREQHQVNLATIPENDFSKLNINGFGSMNYSNYSVNAFTAQVAAGPDPVELLTDSPLRLPHSTSTASSTACSAPLSNTAMTVLLAKLDRTARSMTVNDSYI